MMKNDRLASLLLALGLLLSATLTLIPSSATLIWDIQWLPLHLAAMALVLIGSALTPSHPDGQNNPIPLLSLCLIAIGWVAGAFYGPFAHRALLYAVPGLFAVCTGFLWIQRGIPELFSTRQFKLTFAVYLIAWSALSIYRFAMLDVLPAWQNARLLDQAADGGLFDILWADARAQFRNGYPTGHQNYNSGFLLLALPLLWTGLRSGSDRIRRALAGAALVGGSLVLLTLQSRNTFAGLLLGGAVLYLNVRGRRGRFPRRLWMLAPVAAVLFLALSPRIISTLTTFSPARWGMWKGAFLTGLNFFPFGCGEGLTPEMLYRFSQEIGPRWPSAIQFHQTWLQFWAIGGIPATTGIFLLSLWIARRLLTGASGDGTTDPAPSVFALAATAAVMLADYQWDIYPITLLLLLHLARLTTLPIPHSAFRIPKAVLLVPTLAALLIALCAVPGALRSRRAIDDAGLAAETNDLPAAIAHFERANRIFPEPYSLNMAGQLLARDPAQQPAALDAFQRSLTLLEAQPVAHDFLAELYFRLAQDTDRSPSERRQALEQAVHHARRTAEIAPELRGVHLRHARFLARLGTPENTIFNVLTDALLNNPLLVLPQTWAAYPELTAMREPFLRYFMALAIAPENKTRRVLGIRQAWLQRLELDPIGASLPPAFHESIARSLENRPALRLLQAACNAADAAQITAFRRLFVYLLRKPVEQEAARTFLTHTLPPAPSIKTFLLATPIRPEPTRFVGNGIQARHPKSLPLPRPSGTISSLGTKVLE